MVEAHRKGHAPRLNGTLMAQKGPSTGVEGLQDASLVLLTCRDDAEPMTGIEPAYSAWEAVFSDARSAEPGRGLAETKLFQQRQLPSRKASPVPPANGFDAAATGWTVPSPTSSYLTYWRMGDVERFFPAPPPSVVCRAPTGCL